MKFFLLKFWPVLAIFIIWFVFCFPYFLQHTVPFPATYQVNNFAPWSAYSEFASPVKNGAMPDIITQIYPWKYFTIQTWKMGQIPLWNPYSFSGTPHLANYQSAVLSPINLLFFIFPFIDAWSISVLLQPLLAGLFMYLYARTIKISQTGSLLTAISFMFCGFIVTWMDYGTLGYAFLFLPLALFATEKYALHNQSRYLILLASTLPLSFFSGHFQISFYMFLFLVLYIIFISFRDRKMSVTLYLSLAIFFGLCMIMPQVLPSLEFYTQSVRSAIFQKVEVIPWLYSFTFLSPDFFGNPVTRNDWFGHYAEWNGYIGLFPLMLAWYSLKNYRNSFVLFFFLSGILALLTAFPSPLQDILVSSRFPVLATSSLSRIIAIYSLSFCILAGFGFDTLYRSIQERKYTSVFLWIGAFAASFICLWIIIFKRLILPFDKIMIAKQNLLLPSVLFIVISAIIVLMIVSKKFRLAKLLYFFSFLLLFITAFDSLRFATKWQPFDPKNLVYPTVPVIQEFNKIASFNRVLGNLDAASLVYFTLPSIEGYDPLYIKQYGQFIASMTTGKITNAERSVVTFNRHSDNTERMIELLNITYIIHKKSDDYVSWTFPYWDYPGQFQQIYEDRAYRVLRNSNALPHAFLVNSTHVITNKQEVINKLFSSTFNPLMEAVVDRGQPLTGPTDTKSNAKILTYTPDKIVIQTSSQQSALLVLLDNNYPGWKAFIENKSTPIYTTDYTFRGIRVPPGKHLVSFVYYPHSFLYGLLLGVVGIVGSILTAAVHRKSFTKKNTTN